MHKLILTGVVLAGAVLLTALFRGADAQSDTAKAHIGTVHVDFDKLAGVPGFYHMTGHVKMTSDDYDLNAGDIKIYFVSGGKAGVSGLQQAVAVGGAVPGSQVIAHIRRPLDSESSEIYSDRAVYLPDKTRPGGGRMDFTGHVKVITKSGFFAEPSVSTFETAAVLLGAGSDYPQIETGPGQITLTPAQ